MVISSRWAKDQNGPWEREGLPPSVGLCLEPVDPPFLQQGRAVLEMRPEDSKAEKGPGSPDWITSALDIAVPEAMPLHGTFPFCLNYFEFEFLSFKPRVLTNSASKF